MSLEFNACALVPVYNHHQRLPETIANIRQYGLSVIMVDDGSDEPCKSVMRQLAASDSKINLIEHTQNAGKGAAIKTGLRAAAAQGFSHALQMDADGQHNSDDIPQFLHIASERPDTLLSGKPKYDKSVPKGRLYGRYLTHVLVWINTLSFNISDSMCGFRIYPVARSCALLQAETMGDRMDFDTEFMVRWQWRNWPLLQFSTRVVYPEHGISHFNMWRDNVLISWMHTRLFFGMLWRLPKLLLHKLRSANS